MEHIQDPVDEPPTPLKGRNPQRGRAVERKTRRSKRGDHGLATRHLVRRQQPNIMENNRAKRHSIACQQ